MKIDFKKLALIAGLIAGIAVLLFAFGGRTKEMETVSQSAYLRIHIRADSNESAAQAVKYRVRDQVVAYLTPVVAEAKTKTEAMSLIQAQLPNIERVAKGVLEENGFSYGAKAALTRENFPTRVYENVTLEAGEYDALILNLGSGAGDNWWCVVYPPLCFAGGNGNIIYQSKIKEIIERFFS